MSAGALQLVRTNVLIHYEGDYFPGVVLKKEESGATVKVMEIAGVDTWKWPEKENIITMKILKLSLTFLSWETPEDIILGLKF